MNIIISQTEIKEVFPEDKVDFAFGIKSFSFAFVVAIFLISQKNPLSEHSLLKRCKCGLKKSCELEESFMVDIR
jgi:hypothetical protein